MPVAEPNKLAAMLRELALREKESLRMYRPTPKQDDFHCTASRVRIVRGGNRSGKTVCCAAEFASAVTGIPLRDSNGKELPSKYPTHRPLLAWVIGYDEAHLGGTIYRKLFEPGAFQMIKDKATKKWRVWDPNREDDAARESEAQPSPPLIPKRAIDPKGWSWKDKQKRVFSVCRLKNGTEIRGWSSKAAPGQGVGVDLIWIDEDVHFPANVMEWVTRLSDAGVDGKLVWSAWPHDANDALVSLSERAGEEAGSEDPTVSEVVLRYSDNPFISAKQKRETISIWSVSGPDEVRSRDEGLFMLGKTLVYPEYSTATHGLPSEGVPSKLDLAIAGYTTPMDWTNYLVVDPGHTRAACLFASVAPPEYGDFVVVYDELYVDGANADSFANQVRHKAGGRLFEAFLIDGHAGRQTPMGFSSTVQRQYVDAFKKHELFSARTGSNFIWGSDDVPSRMGLLHTWMRIRSDGTTKLRTITAKTGLLKREMSRYKKKIVRDATMDVPVVKNNDLIVCLEYLAGYNPQWVPVRQRLEHVSPAMRALEKIQKEERGKNTGYVIGVGPQQEREPSYG